MSKKKTEMPENLPESVRQQAEDIEQRIADFKRAGTPEAPAPVVDAPTSEGNPTEAHAAADPVAPAAPATIPEPAPVVPDIVAEQAAKIAELQKQLDRANGTYGGTVQQLKAQIADLSAMVASFGKDKQVTASTSATPQAASAQVTAPPAAVPQEMVERYGQDFIEAVGMIARMQVESAKHDLDSVVQSATKPVVDRLQRIESHRFIDEVERLCPGASSINGDPSANIAAAPGWGEFLDMPVSDGALTTRREEAQRAFQTGNARRFADLVEQYKATTNPKPAPKAAIKPPVVPVSVRGSGEPQSDPAKRMIPQSEIMAWQAKCEQRRHEISPEELEKKTREYSQAYKEGRVVRAA